MAVCAYFLVFVSLIICQISAVSSCRRTRTSVMNQNQQNDKIPTDKTDNQALLVRPSSFKIKWTKRSERNNTPNIQIPSTNTQQQTRLLDPCEGATEWVHIEEAYNQRNQLRKVHSLVYVTYCKNGTAGLPCQGLINFDIDSACLAKLGWAFALVQPIVEDYGPIGQYRWEYIAVNRSCSCALEQ